MVDIGLATDFKIYDELYYSGVWEGISQVVDGFNAASAGTIQLVANQRKGDYVKTSFFKDNSGLITHRDTTSVSAATDQKLTQDEIISVKVNRMIGPTAQTLDAWRKVAKDSREMSFILGQMTAAHKAEDYINTAIKAVTAALKGQSSVIYDATGQSTKTVTHPHIVSTMAKLGDYASRVRCLVMYSKNYFDLVQNAIADKIFEVAGATIYSGIPPTFNKPVLVIDSPALWDLNGSATDTYSVLLLTDGAVVLEESEEQDIVGQVITGLQNLVFRVQGEYAFNLKVKGFKWDTQNGGINPTDAEIATSSNWDLAISSLKNGPGALLKVQ